MGKVPLRSIRLGEMDVLVFLDYLFTVGLTWEEAWKSPRIDIEVYPKEKRGLITIVEPKDAGQSKSSDGKGGD